MSPWLFQLRVALFRDRRFNFDDQIEYYHRDKIWMTYKALGEVKNAAVAIEVGETNRVHLEDLPSLRSFCSGDIVEWSSNLENMVINSCPNIKKFGLGKIKDTQFKSIIIDNQFDTNVASYLFELSDKFSMIDVYNVDHNQELVEVLNNLRPSHFTNLLSFQAKNCDENINKFLNILMKRSKKLQVITIEQCKTSRILFDLDQLIPDKDGYGKYLTQLKELTLTKLDQLIWIWNIDPSGILGFENLQMIHVKLCPSLIYLIPRNVVEKLHRLKELKLEECNSMKRVVHFTTGERKIIKLPALSNVELKFLQFLRTFSDYPIVFPGLKTLLIENCPVLRPFSRGFESDFGCLTTDGNSLSELIELKLDTCHSLIYVISSETLQELENLKKLIVIHCKSLEKVFKISGEIYHSTELLHQLDEMILIDLPNLTHIIETEFTKFYQNMQILQVKQCNSLKWLAIPLMLTKIEIADCKALKKIMIIHKEEGAGRKVIFSQLKDVSLENLTNLSIVFPSSSEFPSLETLKITNCPALMTFVEESNAQRDLQESATSNCFFPNSLSLDKLKVLYVINQDVNELWHWNCPSKSFCELQNLTLSNNKKLQSVISSSLIIRFNKLKKLTLEKCEVLTEVFDLKDDKPDHNIQKMLPELGLLALSNLSKLTSLWNKEPQVPFFPNLVLLLIAHCHTLKSLFSLASVKNLENLKLLKLCNCKELEEVMSSDKHENFSIIFPKLECLVLKDLPKLASFCKKSGTFNWPILQSVRVRNIPSMEIFSRDNVNTPLLGSVYISFAKKLWCGSLNKTISYMHKHNHQVYNDDYSDDNAAKDVF